MRPGGNRQSVAEVKNGAGRWFLRRHLTRRREHPPGSLYPKRFISCILRSASEISQPQNQTQTWVRPDLLPIETSAFCPQPPQQQLPVKYILTIKTSIALRSRTTAFVKRLFLNRIAPETVRRGGERL